MFTIIITQYFEAYNDKFKANGGDAIIVCHNTDEELMSAIDTIEHFGPKTREVVVRRATGEMEDLLNFYEPWEVKYLMILNDDGVWTMKSLLNNEVDYQVMRSEIKTRFESYELISRPDQMPERQNYSCKYLTSTNELIPASEIGGYLINQEENPRD